MAINIDDEARPVGAILLLVGAGAHLFLAHDYTDVVVGSGPFNGNGVSQGFLFYVVGAVMLGLALALLRGGSRAQGKAWSIGGGVMAVALLALLTYRYGSPGEIGPIPDMSNSSWLPVGKPVAALAELLFVALALGRRPLQRRRDRADDRAGERWEDEGPGQQSEDYYAGDDYDGQGYETEDGYYEPGYETEDGYYEPGYQDPAGYSEQADDGY